MSLQIVVKNSAVTGKEPTAQQLANGEIALNYHADGPFLTCKDTNGTVRRITGVWINSVAPANPTAGGLWLDLSVNPPLLRVYQSAAVGWVESRPIPTATSTAAGIVELATNTETQDGVSSTVVVTPASLQAKLSDSVATTSSTAIASSTAVKAAYDLAAGAVPKTGYTNGQLLIGKTDGTLAKATLTAGSGIAVTNGNGTITIATVGGGSVTGVTATSPLASSGGTAPNLTIQDASTTQKGAVQLENSISSVSTTTAATPSSVKTAYDLANAAMPRSGGTFTGAVTIPSGSTVTGYAPLASPTFTGTPAAPTAAVDTNTTQLATTAYVVGQGYLKSATASSTYAPLASPTFTGQPYVNGSYRSNIVSVAALDIDCSAGNYFTKTISANSTFTVSNVPSSRAYSFTLELTHTSGTVTWFSGVQWPAGTAPTLTTGKTHLFMFVTDDGGTRWRAASLVDYTT